MAVKELKSPPSMRVLYPKAVAGLGRAAVGKLPLIGGGDGAELPDVELVLRGQGIDRRHLHEYDRVCGFRLRDEVPSTYVHVLAFPLAMQLMTDGSFPFQVIGMVHIANRIDQIRPIAAGEQLDLHVWAENLRPHDKGTQFEVTAEARAGDSTVWRSASTYLHREGGGSESSKKERDDSEPPEPSAVWKIPGDIGRRYAAVSGDRNPIHLNPVSARLFGMPKPIAHGMWMKARCLAAIEGHLPDAYSTEVRFKLPCFIPAKVAFSTHQDERGRSFSLRDAKSGKPHLDGRVSALPAAK